MHRGGRIRYINDLECITPGTCHVSIVTCYKDAVWAIQESPAIPIHNAAPMHRGGRIRYINDLECITPGTCHVSIVTCYKDAVWLSRRAPPLPFTMLPRCTGVAGFDISMISSALLPALIM